MKSEICEMVENLCPVLDRCMSIGILNQEGRTDTLFERHPQRRNEAFGERSKGRED
jgi:hypothetical protein